MSRRQFIFASVLLLCLAPFAAAQDERSAPEQNPRRTFLRAEESPPDSPTAFEFELSDFSYRVSLNGNGARTREGKRARVFNLRLEGGEAIWRVYFSEYEGDLLLICELKSSKGANGGAAVFRLLQPSMRARWAQRIPSNNIITRREGSSLFIAGTGLVARLDLNSGEYDWRHVNLHKREPGRFRIFDEPEVSGGEVLFREKAGYNPSPTRTIVADKKTGDIIRVE